MSRRLHAPDLSDLSAVAKSSRQYLLQRRIQVTTLLDEDEADELKKRCYDVLLYSLSPGTLFSHSSSNCTLYLFSPVKNFTYVSTPVCTFVVLKWNTLTP